MGARGSTPPPQAQVPDMAQGAPAQMPARTPPMGGGKPGAMGGMPQALQAMMMQRQQQPQGYSPTGVPGGNPRANFQNSMAAMRAMQQQQALQRAQLPQRSMPAPWIQQRQQQMAQAPAAPPPMTYEQQVAQALMNRPRWGADDGGGN